MQVIRRIGPGNAVTAELGWEGTDAQRGSELGGTAWPRSLSSVTERHCDYKVAFAPETAFATAAARCLPNLAQAE
jgi:hypothetical protein